MRSRHRGSGTSRDPSQRQLRVGELIRHTLAELLARGDLHDPVIAARVITVPEVRMTADLRLATIYVVPLGGRDEGEVLAALERNVLRIGLLELERGEVPVEVAIDEAVSLAKRYASDEAGRLVNGVLGRVAREAA